MNIMSWNIRGMNTDDNVSQVFTLLHSHRLTFLSLFETKLYYTNIAKQQMKLPNWNLIHNNDTCCKGRILIIIDKSVWDYDVVSKSQQHVTLILSNKLVLQCNCTCVYASNFFSNDKYCGICFVSTRLL